MLPIVFSHCGNSIVITNFNHEPKDAKNGNPYNTTFNITVESEGFKGICGCDYNITEFILFAKHLNDLYNFNKKSVELRELGYGSHIIFEMGYTGHVVVSGEIYGDAMTHCLKFEFYADQTSLKPFCDSLQKLLNTIKMKGRPLL